MDLNHGLLVLLVVVGSDRAGRPDHIHNLSELVHFGPVGSVEAVTVS
jgi:hypothetical protein